MTHASPITTAALLATVAFSSAAFADDAVDAGPFHTGMTELRIADASRPLEGFLWYPTEDTSATVRAHGNAVWEPIRVIPYATVADGAHPLVLMSHGMFGNARNQAWLAAELTAQGYIVAAIDHPGTSTFSRDPDQRRALWERPRDISRTLDYILALDDIDVDADHIYMVGHSLGGWTAVELAGGRFDADRMDAFCEEGLDDLVCGIFGAWQVAQTPEDRTAMAQDLSDDRFAAIASFDLGGTQFFTPESLAQVPTPMLVIGAPIASSGIDLDVESRALIAALPEGTPYIEPAGLAHFDFLGVCTPQAMEILLEEEPDDAFVCEDGTEERRAEHAMIVQEVIAFFEAN